MSNDTTPSTPGSVKVGDTFTNTDINDTPIPVGATVEYTDHGLTHPKNPMTVIRVGKKRKAMLCGSLEAEWHGELGTIRVLTLPTPAASVAKADPFPNYTGPTLVQFAPVAKAVNAVEVRYFYDVTAEDLLEDFEVHWHPNEKANHPDDHPWEDLKIRIEAALRDAAKRGYPKPADAASGGEVDCGGYAARIASILRADGYPGLAEHAERIVAELRRQSERIAGLEAAPHRGCFCDYCNPPPPLPSREPQGEVRRWRVYRAWNNDCAEAKDPTGRWVEHSDHARALAAVNDDIEKLKTIAAHTLARAEAAEAESARLRGALENIIRHNEIVVGGGLIEPTTSRIARAALHPPTVPANTTKVQP